MPSAPAARRYDYVTHGLLGPIGRTAGVGLGVAADVLLIVWTGGLKKMGQEAFKANAVKAIGEIAGNIADMMDLAVLASWALGGAGDWVDGLLERYVGFPGVPTGVILDGAKTVYTEKLRAARDTDRVMCFGNPIASVIAAEMNIPVNLYLLSSAPSQSMDDKLLMAAGMIGHVGSTVADGSISVEIEGERAARVGSGCTCNAKVSKGAKTVFIGGTLVSRPGTETRSDVGAGYQLVLNLFPVISLALGIGSSLLKGAPTDPTKRAGELAEVRSIQSKILQLLLKGIGMDGLAAAASTADRANKIRAKIADGKKLHEALKESTAGIAITTGKNVQTVTKIFGDGETTKYTTANGGTITFDKDGRTYATPGTTESDIDLARKQVERERIEAENKRIRDQNEAFERIRKSHGGPYGRDRL